jgi:hypothetical protein
MLRPKFKIGETLVLKTDPDQLPRICTGYTVRAHSVEYNLACATVSSWHFGIEISRQSSATPHQIKGLCPPEKK